MIDVTKSVKDEENYDCVSESYLYWETHIVLS